MAESDPFIQIPAMNIVQIDSVSCKLPSAWNELTKKQLIFVSKLFSKSLTIVDFEVQALYEFLSIKNSLFFKIHPEDAYFLCQTFDFLIKDVNLTRNVMPVLWHRFHKYYGPSDNMLQCTFGEFTRAHSHLEQYLKTKDEKVLSEIVAILYRPKKTAWWIRKHFASTKDPRRKLHDLSLKNRTASFKTLDPVIKYGVFLFFTGVLNSLPEQFPNVFRKRENSEENKHGWVPLVISLADGKTDDESLDRVLNSNLYNVFFGLEQKATEYFKFIAETKRHE